MLARDARYRAEAWMAPHLSRNASVEVFQSWTYLPRWQHEASVRKPGFDELSSEAVRARNPELIVLSSKAKEGITMYPNPDWRDGRGMMLVDDDNRTMLDRLESGSLGYERVARFERRTLIPRELITSLDPAIDVYRRVGAPEPGDR
jgi:hypothetical protein